MRFNKYLFLSLFLSFNVSALGVYPEVSAKIISIANVGAVIDKGEVLVQLDDRQAKLQIKKLQAELKIKKQSLDDLELEYENALELYESTVIAKRKLDVAKIARDNAETEYNIKKIELEIAKIELEKYKIMAPFKSKVISHSDKRNVTNINSSKLLMMIEKE